MSDDREFTKDNKRICDPNRDMEKRVRFAVLVACAEMIDQEKEKMCQTFIMQIIPLLFLL
jgi:hypothetical protein